MEFQLFYLNGRFIYRAHARFGCANVVCGSILVAVVQVSKLGKLHDAVSTFAIHALRVLSSSQRVLVGVLQKRTNRYIKSYRRKKPAVKNRFLMFGAQGRTRTDTPCGGGF